MKTPDPILSVLGKEASGKHAVGSNLPMAHSQGPFP